MDLFESLRTDAAQLHTELVQKGLNPKEPEKLIVAAVEHLGLTLSWVEPDDPTLKGARALHDEQLNLLVCAKEPDPVERALVLAHEIGHVRLHNVSSFCHADDIDPSRSSESAPVGLERVEDYGAYERRELQANVYGRELLLPRALARALHVSEQRGAGAIAHQLRLPKDLVRQQILDALLLPEAPEPTVTETQPTKKDDSQDRAAAHRSSPFLLQAGPGTGKTRTLVKRLAGLLSDNVDPASILVLTFSNRAAGELAERISAIVPQAAPKIWIGTFHAFGLDLIRRFHDKLDLPADPMLFDRSDAIEVLEEILPTLPLKHYRNLWDPAMVLRDIVAAVSRAKDELADPARYRALSEAMLTSAADENARKAAEKALEVAQVYGLYEQALRERHAVDFGDLIMRPALLLESDESLRNLLQLRHRHIMVDEYQDVNYASARLLKVVAGDGKRLWTVGDARQSIYRFRGASSSNLARFLSEYPGAQTQQLDLNYRSHREILDLVEGFAQGMDASQRMLPLTMIAVHGQANRRPGIRDHLRWENEIAGIAASIRELERSGVHLREQAVLCRTNARLNDIAEGLEARGIPVLHLGSLFERPEIRDCLALLSLAIDPYATGIVRLATLHRYRMPLQDVQVITRAAHDTPGPTLKKLTTISRDERLSAQGTAALALLDADLKELTASQTAWEFLTTWLLDSTRHIVEIATDTSVAGSLRGVALWQFLNFVRTPGPPVKGPPIRRTLDRVRQLLLLAEERDLRQVPAPGLRMDAVRLMTIHGSKGLEFEAVHIPCLVSTGVPASPQGQRCPPPIGLCDEDGDGTHAMEEECLFFVAASRARSYLRFTRHTQQDTGKNRSASDYLGRILRFAVDEGSGPELERLGGSPLQQLIRVHWPPDWHPTEKDIQSYKDCPRRVFYTRVLGLETARKPTAFSRTHDCLYDVIEWLSSQRVSGDPGLDATVGEFDRIWAVRGPTDHAYAQEYRRLALQLIESLVRLGAGRRFQASEPLALDLPNGRVMVDPGEISQLPDGAIVLRRVRTGRKRSDEYDRIEYTLHTLAGRAQFGPACRFEAVHLTDTNGNDPIAITPKKINSRRETASSFLAKLRGGEFPASPDAVRCPRCPHFFICNATPEGPLTPPG